MLCDYVENAVSEVVADRFSECQVINRWFSNLTFYPLTGVIVESIICYRGSSNIMYGGGYL